MRTAAIAVLVLLTPAVARAEGPNIGGATLGEAGQETAEVSTDEVAKILADKSALVLDARPHLEFAISHLPGARNVAAKPGVPMSKYVSDVAEIGRLVRGNKRAALVLYCNGPYCGKSKRLAAELRTAGYQNVRRYQLGIPVWRALGGVTQIEPDGAAYVRERDRSAVWIDVRPAADYQRQPLPGAINLERARVVVGKDVGEVKQAKDDGRLPMNDHNARLVVFGADPADARFVAEQIAREAFHNVSFYGGTAAELIAASAPR